MKCIVKTDVGRIREENQDSYLVNTDNYPIYAIADGMGGHKGGSVASRIAVESLYEYTKSAQPSEIEIGNAIAYANQNIYLKAQRDTNLYKMGTTLTVLWRDNNKFYLGHVGDSRCYLLRDGNIKKVSTDHSFVNELITKGEITEAQARVHPGRNIVTRSVGTKAYEKVDTDEWEIKKGDKWLLCSDGLTEHLEDADLCRIIEENSLDKAADILLNTCLERGAVDNVSFVLLEEDNA